MWLGRRIQVVVGPFRHVDHEDPQADARGSPNPWRTLGVSRGVIAYRSDKTRGLTPAVRLTPGEPSALAGG
jgi:hypothetical protein